MNDTELFTCSDMQYYLEWGETALEYLPKFREFGIKVLDGGTSVIGIRNCPWCGKPLPSSLRDEWTKRLESLGLEPNDANIPEDMKTDIWWKKQSL